jgi:hypothetical protein
VSSAGSRGKDHQTLFTPQHHRRRVPAGDIAAAYAHVDDVGKLAGLLPEAVRRREFVVDGAGIVEEDVEPALFSHDLRVIGFIDAHGNAPSARSANGCGRRMDRAWHGRITRLFRTARDIDGAAMASKRNGDTPASTSVGARLNR